MKKYLSILLLLSSFNLLAASPLIYGVRSAEKSINTSYNVVLKKEALNKDFMFSASRLNGYPVATGSSLKSKVVYFQIREGKLYMFENTKGLMVSDSIKTKVLLASFPVLVENDEEIIVDFDGGMSALLVKGSMWSSDYSGGSEDYLIKIDDSFIEKIENRADYVFIDQFIRVANETYRMKYQLALYKPDPTFNPKKSTLLKKIGYFETHPILDPEATERDKVEKFYILKYDENKPVTYYVSSNTPKEYRNAVRDGILYWNKAFGKDFLKVEFLDKEVTPHDPDLNLVQWVDWTTAGFAYANIQADPMTGQTLNSTVYMTSSFAISSVKEAKETLLRLTLDKDMEGQKETTALKLKGFEENHVCNFHSHESIKYGLSQTLNEVIELPKEEQEAIIKRISSDHIAAVVAHEVGHTLGLRHNFAATVEGNVTLEQWPKLLKKYILEDVVHEETSVSTSIMDYTALLVSTVNGAKIRKAHPPLKYDEVAIQWGYTKKKVEEFEVPLFCTDSQVNTYKDCERWDQFSDPVAGALDSFEYSLKYAPFYLFNSFLSLTEKKQDGSLVWDYLTQEERTQKIQSVALSPQKLAAWIVKKWEKMIGMAYKGARFLKVESDFPYISDFNQEEVNDKTLEYIQGRFKEHGGLTKLSLFPFYLVVGEDIRFKNQFDSTFTRYMAPFSNKFETHEIEMIKKMAGQFSDLLEKELYVQLSESLTKANFAFYSRPFEMTLMDWMKKILFTKSGNILFTLKEDKPFYEYKYQYTNSDGIDLRTNFVKLLTTDLFKNNPSYSRRRKKASYELYDTFKARIELLKKEGELESLSDEMYNWMYDEANRFSPLVPSRRYPDIFDRL